MPAKKTKLAGAKRFRKTARQAERTNDAREFERAFDILAKGIMICQIHRRNSGIMRRRPIGDDLTFRDGDLFA
jgi:hypothetical protein